MSRRTTDFADHRGARVRRCAENPCRFVVSPRIPGAEAGPILVFTQLAGATGGPVAGSSPVAPAKRPAYLPHSPGTAVRDHSRTLAQGERYRASTDPCSGFATSLGLGL